MGMARTTRKSGIFTNDNRFTEPEFVPYAAAIGQIALAWNSLHEAMGGLLWALLGGWHLKTGYGDKSMPPLTAVGRLWNAVGSDREKRKMLRQIAICDQLTTRQDHPSFDEDIKWLLAQTDAQEEERNNAVHAPLIFLRKDHQTSERLLPLEKDLGPAPYTLTHNSRAIKLDKKKDLLSDLRVCRETILALRDFCSQMEVAIVVRSQPWPRRPSLPSRGEKKSRSHRKRPSQKVE